ncbi:MAG: hypothetical protein H7263_13930 [Candidatus Sericytochromatia bacterium]|nr:hypothetical protein [Candidatus Sericytochromatia bacterium]
MKKNLLAGLFASVIILSACGSDINANLATIAQNSTIQAQSTQSSNTNQPLNLTNQQIEKLVRDNSKDIQKVAKMLYMKQFADESIIPNYKNDLITPEFKGGVLFNILNRSDFAKKLIYGLGSYEVKKKFAKPDVADNFPVINQAQTNELLNAVKPGDILLNGIDDSFIHAIVYAGNGIIIHALGSADPKFWGVIKEPLTTYLARSNRDKFIVLRYTKATPDDIAKEINFASQQVGKPYDSLFLLNADDRFYCTELAFRSLTSMANPPRVYPHKAQFGWELIDNTDFMDSPDLQTVWTLNKDRSPVGKLHTYN